MEASFITLVTWDHDEPQASRSQITRLKHTCLDGQLLKSEHTSSSISCTACRSMTWSSKVLGKSLQSELVNFRVGAGPAEAKLLTESSGVTNFW